MAFVEDFFERVVNVTWAEAAELSFHCLDGPTPIQDVTMMSFSCWVRMPSNPMAALAVDGIKIANIFEFGAFERSSVDGSIINSAYSLTTGPDGAGVIGFFAGLGSSVDFAMVYNGLDNDGNPIQQHRFPFWETFAPAGRQGPVTVSNGPIFFDQWYLCQYAIDVTNLVSYLSQPQSSPGVGSPSIPLTFHKVLTMINGKVGFPTDLNYASTESFGGTGPDGETPQVWTQDHIVPIKVAGYPLGLPTAGDGANPALNAGLGVANDIVDVYELMVWFGRFIDFRNLQHLFYTPSQNGSGFDATPKGTAANAIGTPSYYFTGGTVGQFSKNQGSAGSLGPFIGTLKAVPVPRNIQLLA